MHTRLEDSRVGLVSSFTDTGARLWRVTARCAYDLVGEDFHAVVRSSACAPDHVLERHPDGFVAQPGYVWLDMPGKVWHVGKHELEFR